MKPAWEKTQWPCHQQDLSGLYSHSWHCVIMCNHGSNHSPTTKNQAPRPGEFKEMLTPIQLILELYCQNVSVSKRTRRIWQFGRDPLNPNGLVCEKHNYIYIYVYTNIYMYRWFSHQNLRHWEQTHQPPQKLPWGRPDVQLHPAGTCSRCCCRSMRCNCTCLMAVDPNMVFWANI